MNKTPIKHIWELENIIYQVLSLWSVRRCMDHHQSCIDKLPSFMVLGFAMCGVHGRSLFN